MRLVPSNNNILFPLYFHQIPISLSYAPLNMWFSHKKSNYYNNLIDLKFKEF